MISNYGYLKVNFHGPENSLLDIRRCDFEISGAYGVIFPFAFKTREGYLVVSVLHCC